MNIKLKRLGVHAPQGCELIIRLLRAEQVVLRKLNLRKHVLVDAVVGLNQRLQVLKAIVHELLARRKLDVHLASFEKAFYVKLECKFFLTVFFANIKIKINNKITMSQAFIC